MRGKDHKYIILKNELKRNCIAFLEIIMLSKLLPKSTKPYLVYFDENDQVEPTLF